MTEYARSVVASGRAGVNQICRMFGLSKKTYYYGFSPEETLQRRYGWLKVLIEKIIEANPAYGYRRIKKSLEEDYGEVVNHKLLLRVLRAWGLQLKRRIRAPRKSWVRQILDFLQIRANLVWRLARGNMLKGCFRVVVSDVTELVYQGGKAYLCVHMDIFGKMLYGWNLKEGPDSDLVIQSLKKAVLALKRILGTVPSSLIFHQDRGSVYTGCEYVTAVLSQKFQLSYSRTGEPGDNAVNESFFSRLKEEWRDVFYEAKSFEELSVMVEKAIDYYNNDRYHSSIGLQAPVKYTMDQANRLTVLSQQVVS